MATNTDGKQVSVTSYLRSDSVQGRINDLLKDRAGQFTASLMAALNGSPKLLECKPETVLSAAINAASLDLPVNANLGFAYLIPYNDKNLGWIAQFQMGYKGFIQLAQRSGQYKTINATDVREGEMTGNDRLSGEIQFDWIEDEEERLKKPVIGYVAYFRLTSGFTKTKFMSMKEMGEHGKKFSQSYKKGYGLWATDFDSMAKKTVIKLLISKFGPMNTAISKAIETDQAVIEGDDISYLDRTPDPEKKDLSDEEKEKAKADAAAIANGLIPDEEE